MPIIAARPCMFLSLLYLLMKLNVLTEIKFFFSVTMRLRLLRMFWPELVILNFTLILSQSLYYNNAVNYIFIGCKPIKLQYVTQILMCSGLILKQ